MRDAPRAGVTWVASLRLVPCLSLNLPVRLADVEVCAGDPLTYFLFSFIFATAHSMS